MNDSWGEVVCCQLFDELPERKKLVSGKESREKTRQIRNYEIRHKRNDECALCSIGIQFFYPVFLQGKCLWLCSFR